MIISTAADLFCCKPKNVHIDRDTIKTIAYVLDWITAVALLTIGLLALTNVITVSCLGTGLLLGAGAVYTAIMLLSICVRSDFHCGAKKSL